MKNRFTGSIGTISVLSVALLLNSCSSYYLQHLETTFTSPDITPVVAPDRSEGDLRVAAGATVNPRNEISFNDGNHADTTVYGQYGVSQTLGYKGDNVYVTMPLAQGSLMLDYTVARHFFIYGKANLGKVDGTLSGAVNVGAGTYFGGRKIAVMGYVAPTFYSLNATALMKYTDYSDTSKILYQLNDKWLFGLGGGFRLITQRGNNRFNFSGGVDFQLQDYFQFTYDDNSDLDYDGTNEEFMDYRAFYITPAVGIIRQFGNSQIDCAVNCTMLIVDTEGDSDVSDDSDSGILPQDAYFSLHLNYTYCFRGHAKADSTK